MRALTASVIAVVLLAAGASCSSAGDGQDRHRFFPNPIAEGGQDARTYTHVPYASAQFVNGKIRVSWGEAYEIVRVFIAADWEFVSDYAPGLEIPLLLEPERRRYDFIGQFIDTRTGEEFVGITPIFCREQVDRLAGSDGTVGEIDFAPTAGCADDVVVLGCTVQDVAEDCNLIVTCDGDSGTCSSCGDSDTACCKSTTTTTLVSPTGVITTTVVKLEKKVDCPKEPDKPKPKPPSAP